MEAYCRRTNTNNFHLHLRLSAEKVNPQRWDEAFIRQEIGKFGFKNIARVWVCGPPIMNETFDRVFSAANFSGNEISDENLLGGGVGLTSDQYEIL